jgi:hypothetical protein
MSLPSHYRRLAMAMALALTAFALAPCTGSVAASGDDGADAVVESAGDPASAIDLPPAAAAGQTATGVTMIQIGIAAGASEIELGVELHTTTAVDDVGVDGSYVTTSTYDDIVVTTGGATANAAAFDVLRGVEFRRAIGASGRLVSVQPVDQDGLTDEQRSAFASVVGNLQGADTVYPDEPVGVGARWSVEQPVSGDSFPVTAAYQYELTAIENGRYTIAVSYSTTVDTVVDGVAAAGTVSGRGSIDGSVDLPLDVSYTIGQATTTTAGGNHVDVTVTVTTESTPA